MSLHNPFGYTGYQTDDVTDLYFAQARYYEPRLGRFGAEDMIRENIGFYQYCLNNPLKYADKNGLWGKDYHEDETAKIAVDCGIDQEWADRIGQATAAVDTGLFTNPITGQWYHFNKSIPGQLDSRYILSEIHYKQAVVYGTKAVDLMNRNKNNWATDSAIVKYIDKAIRELGLALHARQDIYAHGQIGAGTLIISQHKLDLFGDNRSKADETDYGWVAGSGFTRLEYIGKGSQRVKDSNFATTDLLMRFLIRTGLYDMQGFHEHDRICDN